MEFIRQLVAFAVGMHYGKGIEETNQEETESLWIHIVNSPTESAMLANFSDVARLAYDRWIDKWISGQPAAPQEITTNTQELEEGLNQEGLTLVQEPEPTVESRGFIGEDELPPVEEREIHADKPKPKKRRSKREQGN